MTELKKAVPSPTALPSRLVRALGVVFFSPAGWTWWAVAIALCFSGAHLLGWRAYTSVFSGTLAAPGSAGEARALLGLVYAGLYFLAVLVVPVLLVSAGLWALLIRWLARLHT